MSEAKRKQAVHTAESLRAVRCLEVARDTAPDERSRRWADTLARMAKKLADRAIATRESNP